MAHLKSPISWDCAVVKQQFGSRICNFHYSLLPKELNELDSMQSLIKMPTRFCAAVTGWSWSWKAKTIFKKKVEGLTFHHFKTYYNATVIKTTWYWQKGKYIGQWNGIESSDINYTFVVNWLFFFLNKAVKTIQWGKEQSFQQTVLGSFRAGDHNHVLKG